MIYIFFIFNHRGIFHDPSLSKLGSEIAIGRIERECLCFDTKIRDKKGIYSRLHFENEEEERKREINKKERRDREARIDQRDFLS